MKIGIPVKCQNGHKATWVFEFRGLDAVSMGAFGDPNRCKCPKHDIGQGYFPDGEPFVLEQTAASRDVLAERQRQVSAEDFDHLHDDHYQNFELPLAATCYALSAEPIMSMDMETGQKSTRIPECPPIWPWSRAWWKPRSRRENLVRAGALILAEIERIDRAVAQGVKS